MIQKAHIPILLLSTLLLSIPAKALVILQEASLPVNVDYDSNLNLTEQKEGVWRYTSTPKYTLSVTDEKNRWFGDLSLALQRSSNKDISADREDPTLNAGWQREFEKGTFSLTTSYNKRSSRFSQFNTNALVDVDGTSVNKSINANYSHALTDRLNFSLGTGYSTVAYTDSTFVDSTSKSVNGSVSYAYNEKFSPFIQLSFTDFKPSGNLSQPSKSKNFLIGSTVLITPRWTFAPSVGVNSTTTSGNNTSTIGNNASVSGSGWIANTNLSYIAEKSTLQSTLSRSVTPGGLGNLQKTDTFGLIYSHELSQVSRCGVDFNISKSQSDFDSETTQLSGFYARDLSLDWQMRLIAGHRIQKQTTSSLGNTSFSNTNFGISLVYSIPQF